MREILFEYGFESVNGIIKKQYYLHEIPFIQQKCDVFNVLPLVYVRQFTGLLDKNGTKIFEGDMVKWTSGKFYWEAVISVLKNPKTNTLYAVETYCNLSTCLNEFEEEIYSFERTDERKGIRNELEYLSKTLEIIGNIHDHATL